MLRSGWFARTGSILALGALLAGSSALFAQTHVVAPATLQKQAVAATNARRHNEKKLLRFLLTPNAQKALHTAHLDEARVKTAVAGLSDEELAQLTSRADKAEADFAAGVLSNHDLLLIILGLVALIVIIIAVR